MVFTLASKLIGWDIDIISEDVLKKEIAQQMGKMMASGEAVPITALEGVSTAQAEDLKVKGIIDVEALAETTLDDLVDYLDISLDEAESIIASAKAVVEAKNKLAAEETVEVEETETVETEAAETVEESTENEEVSTNE